MSRIPWVFTDPTTLATYSMPINPDTMTTPYPRKQLSHARGNKAGLERARTFLQAPAPVLWSWEGVIRSQEQYDDMLAWAQKPYPIEVTDHLGRTWLVVFKKFKPQERRPKANVPVRMRYQIEVLNLGEVTA